MEKLDGSYLETMQKLHIIDTRVWGTFHVVGLIFNVFLSHDVGKASWKWISVVKCVSDKLWFRIHEDVLNDMVCIKDPAHFTLKFGPG